MSSDIVTAQDNDLSCVIEKARTRILAIRTHLDSLDRELDIIQNIAGDIDIDNIDEDIRELLNIAGNSNGKDPAGAPEAEELDEDAPAGVLIKKLRKERGWTQTRLAEKAGIAAPTVSTLESKPDKRVREETANALARALGVSVEDIFDRSKLSQVGRAPGAKNLNGNGRNRQYKLCSRCGEKSNILNRSCPKCEHIFQ